MKHLFALQDKFIKLLKSDKIPSLETLYKAKCILHHYNSLSEQFINSTSKTRNKSIALPRYNKTTAQNNSIYTGVKYFNKLPNELKVLDGLNNSISQKILKYLK